MAYTTNTGFRYYKDLKGNTASPTPVPVRIANSTTLRVGDCVRINTSGLLVTAAAGDVVGGVLTGFVDNNGINPFSLGYSGAGTTLTGDDTLATSSTNSTRAKYILGEVIMDPSGELLWLNKSDTALAQTNLLQMFDNDANGRQITVGTASDANGQWQLILLDPEASGGKTADSTVGAFRINENQFSAGIDSATAKNAA